MVLSFLPTQCLGDGLEDRETKLFLLLQTNMLIHRKFCPSEGPGLARHSQQLWRSNYITPNLLRSLGASPHPAFGTLAPARGSKGCRGCDESVNVA